MGVATCRAASTPFQGVPHACSEVSPLFSTSPVSSVGSVFECDAEFGEPITNLIRGGKIFFLSRLGANLDQQSDQMADDFLVGALLLGDRLAKESKNRR